MAICKCYKTLLILSRCPRLSLFGLGVRDEEKNCMPLTSGTNPFESFLANSENLNSNHV